MIEENLDLLAPAERHVYSNSPPQHPKAPTGRQVCSEIVEYENSTIIGYNSK